MPLHKAPRGLRSITVQPAVSSLTHLTTKDQAYSELSTWRLRSNPILDGGQGKSAQSFLPCPRSPHIVPTEPLVEKGTQLRRTPDVLPTSTQNIHLGPLCDVQPTGHGGDYATNHIAKLPTHDAPHVATSRRVLPAHRARCAGTVVPSAGARSEIMHREARFHLGLQPPRLNSTAPVTGSSTPRHRIENKRRRLARQQTQPGLDYWTTHSGTYILPPQLPQPPVYRNKMCPRNLALHHPAADLLLDYATNGCPTLTGSPWTTAQM